MSATSGGVLPSPHGASESHARATLWWAPHVQSRVVERSRSFCRCYDEVMNRRRRCSVEQRGDRARRRNGR